MRRLIVLVTGLHVLAHSIFGCCAHAFAECSHSVENHDCGHAVATHDEAGRHTHSHREAAHNNEDQTSSSAAAGGQHSAPHEPHDCSHDSCHWLTSDTLPVIDFLDFQSDATFVPLTSTWTAASPIVGVWPETDVGRYHALALRLHLALGVLLI